ncbi:MAG: DUF1592 domain-containing protein [Planctomycetota bacterium]
MTIRMVFALMIAACLLTSTRLQVFADDLQPFLKSYCTDCHGAKSQKGDRRFDQLPAAINDSNTLADYQDILDQLNLSEMPPPESKQPTDADRKKIIARLTATIADYHQRTNGAKTQTVLRRLNAREYRNTIRDLLHLNMQMFDPTSTFPRDQTVQHLDNVGDQLVTSGYLLARYLDAADQAIEKAILSPARPEVRKWNFSNDFRQQPEIDQAHRLTSRFKWLTLYEVPDSEKPEGAYAAINDFAEGVPADGYYKIRFDVEALNRKHPFKQGELGMDASEPFRLGIVPGDQSAGRLHLPQPVEPLLAELRLPDERGWQEVEVWLDQGYTPRFTFLNGPIDARKLFTRLPRRYPELFAKSAKNGIVAGRIGTIKKGVLPQIRIHEVEISGPYYKSWPTESQKALLGDKAETILASGKVTNVRSLLRQFLKRAYRRPVNDDEIERIVRVIDSRQRDGRTSLEAYCDGLKVALCSPNFLYLEAGGEKLSSYAVASRLSYFLWSSMPDETLFRLADNNALQQPKVFAAEAQRMLTDFKSDALIDGFLDSWLNLRELGSAPPDRKQFNAYYQYDLETAMREETRMFTRHLIEENLDIANFLDSEFTFVNKPLARHYGMEPPKESGFQRVSLRDEFRGGLLGQASVLTVTANGIDTSPVVRGIWVLENILGDPPNPPPPDVEPLDPDIRGAKTIRDQLKNHRDVATCYDCHRKIDPLGFALENFDPVGRWRGSYGRKTKIDASGELPNGTAFRDIRELKPILLANRQQFSRALVTKLFAYAIGREMTASDRPQIDTVAESSNGLRDLIIAVASSPTFRSK